MCAFLRGGGHSRGGARDARKRADRKKPRSNEPNGDAGMLPAEILQRVRRLEIHTKALVSELFAGQYHSVFKGQGMEFAEVREYVPGDDIRTIDWNVTARLGVPFVKKYSEERELTVFLLVDASGSQRFGSEGRSKMELAAEVGAVLAFSAINNHDKVGLLIFTDRTELLIPPRKGRAHGLRIIREILYNRPEGRRTDLAAACETAIHALRRRATVFLLSDFLVDPGPVDQPLGALARKHDLIALAMRDPLEASWPKVGLVEWEDLESGRSFLVDTTDAGVRGKLEANYRRQREQVAAMLRRHKVDQVPLEVGGDPVEPLQAFFRLRERRRARE
ncbi:DUF58 domain-containing protein [Candidatus Eisenbacteria bacterium]|uniref:DUF58 domain-containing protein n=1 Tax=Eiseniibacteriota bacterium TaxID=2212470 RepID=A0ABV6YJB8_UNCEI